MRKVFTLFIFIFISFSILAQGKVIRGKVIDFDSGSPISGVSISVIGTNQTVKTNKAVFFTIKLPDFLRKVQFSVTGYRISNQRHYDNFYELFVVRDIFSLGLTDLMKLQVVSTSKKKENLIFSPANINVFYGKNLEVLNYNRLIDYLEFATGLSSVNGEGNFFYTTTIRGNTRVNYNTNTLLLYNGIKIYNPYNGSFDFQAIPISSIKRVEIVKGSNSVLYGTNAMNGVINVITRDHDLSQPNLVDYGFRAQVGSYNTTATNFFLISKRNDTKFSLYSDLYATTGEPLTYQDELGHTLTYNRGYLGYNVAASLTYGKFRFDMLTYRRREPVVRTRGFSIIFTSPTDTVGKSVPEVNDEQMYIGNLSYNSKLSSRFNLHIQSELLRWTNTKYLVDGQWLYSSLGNFNTIELSTIKSGKFEHLLGLSLDNYIGRRFKTQINDYDIGKEGIFTHEISAYYNGSASLLKFLSVYYGVRLLFSVYKRFFWNLSPRMAFVFRLGNTSSVKLIYGQSFRVPTYFEKEVHSAQVLGNPYLKPEKSISYDAVYSVAYPHLQFNFDVFYTKIKNQIERVVAPFDSSKRINMNIGANIYRGLEISTILNYDRIYGFAGYSFNLANNEQTGMPLKFTYRHMLDMGFLYCPLKFIEIKGAYKYLAKWGPAPAYNLVDLAVSYKMSSLPLDLELRADNVLNTKILLPEIARDGTVIPKTNHRMYYLTVSYRFF